MRAYSPNTVRLAEKYAFDNSLATPLGLMKRAASEMSRVVCGETSKNARVTILCGKGNNAGDGYELADILLKNGHTVVCADVFDTRPTTDIALACHDGFVADGGHIASDIDEIIENITNSDVLIDAIFGIGFKGAVENGSRAENIIKTANNNAFARKIALDVPSGVDSENGSVAGVAFCAEITVTVTAVKIGMLSYPARSFCGKIVAVDIGLADEILAKFDDGCFCVDEADSKKLIPERAVDSNKGDFGKLLCVCGSENMPGAAAMAVGSALRSGVGLVTLAAEKSASDIVKFRFCEPIYRNIDWNDTACVDGLLADTEKYTAILVGCGLGKSEIKRDFLFRLIKNCSGQIIIDADGINMLSENINILREAKKPVTITPHPGEFSRISGQSIEYINANRIKCAVEFSQKYRCITVLKGAGTVISDGNRLAVNTSGNPGLAKGGSGDVLAGLIAGLSANPTANAFESAVCGVYVHGKAADNLAEKLSRSGMLPSELFSEIAKLLP